MSVTAAGPASGHDEDESVVIRAATAGQAAPGDPGPTPTGPCGPGSKPETGLQGRVPPEDHASGRAAQGYTCNTETIGRAGVKGGFRVERYVDESGRECAYYDTTILFPTNALFPSGTPTGTDVLDMTDPTKPALTATLLTPAMQSPHESVSINQKRGLLAAVLGTVASAPGMLDIYDVSQDCRNPTLLSSLPVGILGHEGNFAPDGLTYYASALDGGELTAIDVSNPLAPVPLWTERYVAHGMSISDDGTRAYLATRSGLVILDTTQIQERVVNPTVPVVSRLDWYPMTTPQVGIPVTIGGKPYVVEVDEFGKDSDDDGLEDLVGAARIIDIGDEAKPRVISDLRLDVHTRANRAAISGDENFADYRGFQGYAGHYCSVPQRKEPGVVACTFIESGLRLFDIRDPYNPKEIAYHNEPRETTYPNDDVPTTYAMSTIAFVPERSELWYADGNSGFIAVRVTNGVWPFASSAPTPPAAVAPRGDELPPTGGSPAAMAGAALLVAAVLYRRTTAARTVQRVF
ncbi:MAG TPA: hypothetical protein VMY88_04340 [Acidimicrobiales bacterium]|nr:hypothetical protein [Acidimicrobiales bacterium]